jgi:hypothetical protein
LCTRPPTGLSGEKLRDPSSFSWLQAVVLEALADIQVDLQLQVLVLEGMGHATSACLRLSFLTAEQRK